MNHCYLAFFLSFHHFFNLFSCPNACSSPSPTWPDYFCSFMSNAFAAPCSSYMFFSLISFFALVFFTCLLFLCSNNYWILRHPLRHHPSWCHTYDLFSRHWLPTASHFCTLHLTFSCRLPPLGLAVARRQMTGCNVTLYPCSYPQVQKGFLKVLASFCLLSE